MHRRVNPTSPLTEQNLPIIRRHRVRMRISHELRLETREVLQQQSREVPILSEMQQILHMQCVDPVLRIVVYELVRDEQRLVRVRCPQAVERETTRQTGDGTKERLERLGHVMRDEIFVDLNPNSR